MSRPDRRLPPSGMERSNRTRLEGPPLRHAASTCLVHVKDGTAGVMEISFGRGFTLEDVAVVKAIRGRQWDPTRRAWIVPVDEHIRAALLHRFAGRVAPPRLPDPESEPPEPEPRDRPSDRPGAPRPGNTLLGRMKDRLLLAGFSPSTRKVYLGHVRRALEWTGGDLGTNPASRVRDLRVHPAAHHTHMEIEIPRDLGHRNPSFPHQPHCLLLELATEPPPRYHLPPPVRVGQLR